MGDTNLASRSIGILAATIMGAFAVPASALTFDITYTAAVQANANFGAIQTDINFVESVFSGLYSDNVTLNFTVDQGGGLGGSLFSNAYYRGSYTSIKTALTGDAKSADDATAVASLPATAPFGTGANSWYVTSSQAKALGLLAANNAASDGTYTFGSAAGLFDFDPSDGITAGAYDFIGTTEHEFSELMGRVTQLGNGNFGYTAYDAFRYTAPGVRNVTSGASADCGVYYSIDGGTTNEKGFNCIDPTNADIQDWADGVPSDPFNAYGSPGVVNSLTATDVQVMDVIGWDLASTTVPEPGTLALASLAGLGLLRRRKQA